MNARTLIASILAIGITLLAFQNCGQMKTSGQGSLNQSNSSSSSAPSAMEDDLKLIQQNATTSLLQTQSTPQSLQATLQTLQLLLQQLQAFDVSQQPAAIQQLKQDIILRLNAAITQIQAAIATGMPIPQDPAPGGTANSKVFLPEGYGDPLKMLTLWMSGKLPFAEKVLTSGNVTNSIRQYYSIYQFVVPQHTTLKVKIWGAGAGNVIPGGPSSFAGVIAGGGTGPLGTPASPIPFFPPEGGIASGGTVNMNGAPGTANGTGGSAPNGGVGGKLSAPNVPGGDPGGGGCAFASAGNVNGYGGGSGAYSEKIFQPGELVPGSTIAVHVGFPGIPFTVGGRSNPMIHPCAAGGSGRVEISWQ